MFSIFHRFIKERYSIFVCSLLYLVGNGIIYFQGDISISCILLFSSLLLARCIQGLGLGYLFPLALLTRAELSVQYRLKYIHFTVFLLFGNVFVGSLLRLFQRTAFKSIPLIATTVLCVLCLFGVIVPSLPYRIILHDWNHIRSKQGELCDLLKNDEELTLQIMQSYELFIPRYAEVAPLFASAYLKERESFITGFRNHHTILRSQLLRIIICFLGITVFF